MTDGVSQVTMADLHTDADLHDKPEDYLEIETGAGDDNVNLDAYGTFDITTGAGNDFVRMNSVDENGDATTGDWTFGNNTGPQDFGERVLYNAQLTVSFAGIEATVDVETDAAGNFIADQMTINSAIIDAIESNEELNRLLDTQLNEGTQQLSVTSTVGGANSLAIALYQPKIAGEGADPAAGEVSLNAGDSTAVAQGLIDTGAVANSEAVDTTAEIIDALNDIGGSIDQSGAGDQGTYAYINNDVVLGDAGQTDTGTDIFDTSDDLYQAYNVGGSVDAGTDFNFSTIDLGTGEDTVVMHSNDGSANILRIDGQFGKATVVNLHDVPTDQVGNNGYQDVGNHALEFSFLDNEVDPSDNNNNQSVTDLGVTVNVVAGAESFGNSGSNPAVTNSNDAVANSVNLIRFSEAAADDETFANLDAATLVSALNGDYDPNGDGTADAYGNLDNNLLNAVGNANLVGTTQKHIIMVENDLNEGEYKVFQVTSTLEDDGTVADGAFTSATEIGTLDFGASVNLNVAGNEDYDEFRQAVMDFAETAQPGDVFDATAALGTGNAYADAAFNFTVQANPGSVTPGSVTIERVLEGADQIQVVGADNYTVDSVEEVGSVTTVTVDVNGTKFSQDFAIAGGNTVLRVNTGQTATMNVAAATTFNSIVGEGDYSIADSATNVETELSNGTGAGTLLGDAVAIDTTDDTAVSLTVAQATDIGSALTDGYNVADTLASILTENSGGSSALANANSITASDVDAGEELTLTGLDATTAGTAVDFEDNEATLTQAQLVTISDDANVSDTDADALTITGVTDSAGDFVEATAIDLLDGNDQITFDGNSATLDAVNYADVFETNGVSATSGDEITVTMASQAVVGTAANDTFDYAGTETGANITEFGTGGTDAVDLADVNSASTITDMDVGVAMADNAVFYLSTSSAGDADTVGASATALSASFNDDVDMSGSYAVVADDNSSAIYKVSNTGTDGNDIVEGDLTLIGTVDAVLATGDITVA
jgi:hypothetical protein